MCYMQYSIGMVANGNKILRQVLRSVELQLGCILFLSTAEFMVLSLLVDITRV